MKASKDFDIIIKVGYLQHELEDIAGFTCPTKATLKRNLYGPAGLIILIFSFVLIFAGLMLSGMDIQYNETYWGNFSQVMYLVGPLLFLGILLLFGYNYFPIRFYIYKKVKETEKFIAELKETKAEIKDKILLIGLLETRLENLKII